MWAGDSTVSLGALVEFANHLSPFLSMNTCAHGQTEHGSDTHLVAILSHSLRIRLGEMMPQVLHTIPRATCQIDIN